MHIIKETYVFGLRNKEQCHSPSQCDVPLTACMDPKQGINFNIRSCNLTEISR